MAKEKPAVKETKKAATSEAAKYGVADLAQLLDVDPATCRVKLRNAGVKKTVKGGASYGWDSKEELKAVAEKLNAKKAPAEKKAAPAKEEKKAPAKEKVAAKKDAPAKDTKKAANDKDVKKGKKAA